MLGIRRMSCHLFVDMLQISNGCLGGLAWISCGFPWMLCGCCIDVRWIVDAPSMVFDGFSKDDERLCNRLSMDIRQTIHGLSMIFNRCSMDLRVIFDELSTEFYALSAHFRFGFQSVSDVTPSGVRWTFSRCSTNARCIPDSCPMDFRRMVKWPPCMFGQMFSGFLLGSSLIPNGLTTDHQWIPN